MRRDNENQLDVDAADESGEPGAGDEASELDHRRIDPRRARCLFVLTDGFEHQPKARLFEQSHADPNGQRDDAEKRREPARIDPRHIEELGFWMARNQDFLKFKIGDDKSEDERINKGREREINVAQSQRRIADQSCGDTRDDDRDRNAEPGNDSGIEENDRGISAYPDKGGMPKGRLSGITPDQIPRRADQAPETDQRKDARPIGVLHKREEDEERDEGHARPEEVACPNLAVADIHRSLRGQGRRIDLVGHTRAPLPNKPRGRTNKVSTNRQKTGTSSSASGNTRLDICSIRPTQKAPITAPSIEPMPPRTTAMNMIRI